MGFIRRWATPGSQRIVNASSAFYEVVASFPNNFHLLELRIIIYLFI